MTNPSTSYSSLTKEPFGVCSVVFGNASPVALCPRRFLQKGTVFGDIADHYFKSRDNLIVLDELTVPQLGRFDFVLVKHKPFVPEIEDFAVIEFQGGETTSTGALVRAFTDSLSGVNVAGKNYNFGLNYADIWKRTFTQILNKGIVLEKWGHKIYWVVQEPIYVDFITRYSLQGMSHSDDHATTFAVYDLREDDDCYELYRTRFESSTIDSLFAAFRNKTNIPSQELFMTALKQRLLRKMQSGVKQDSFDMD